MNRLEYCEGESLLVQFASHQRQREQREFDYYCLKDGLSRAFHWQKSLLVIAFALGCAVAALLPAWCVFAGGALLLVLAVLRWMDSAMAGSTGKTMKEEVDIHHQKNILDLLRINEQN